MRKYTFVFCAVFVLFLIGCNSKRTPDTYEGSGTETDSTCQIEDTVLDKENDMSKCRLFIYGKEIDAENLARINYEEGNTEIPLLLIIREIGGQVHWNDNGVVTIEINKQKLELDVTKDDFNILIPPGTTGAVRKIVEDEIVIDGDSVRHFFRKTVGVDICVDKTAEIIYIDDIAVEE